MRAKAVPTRAAGAAGARASVACAMALQGLPGGETRTWITMRDGEWYCRPCWKFVTDEHLSTPNHEQRVKEFNAAEATGSCRWAAPAGNSTGASASGLGAPLTQAAATDDIPPPPPGDPRFYEWDARQYKWKCLLCYAYAEDSHIESGKHIRRAKNPRCYLYERRAEQPPPFLSSSDVLAPLVNTIPSTSLASDDTGRP